VSEALLLLDNPSSEGEQRSEDWRQARAGCVTGTGLACVLAKLKNGGEAKTRRDYRWQLIAERLTGVPNEDRFSSKAMDRGTLLEPEARALYEEHAGVFVQTAGFTPHPHIEWLGASPDGLVGERGCVEIKCPDNSAIHLNSLISGSDALAAALLGEEDAAYTIQDAAVRLPGVGTGTKKLKTVPIPAEYFPQVQGVMWVLDRDWCDYISYDPRFPPHLQLYVHRVMRDDPYISNMKNEVLKFLEEVETAVARLLLPT
jgi:hypothetical protein